MVSYIESYNEVKNDNEGYIFSFSLFNHYNES